MLVLRAERQARGRRAHGPTRSLPVPQRRQSTCTSMVMPDATDISAGAQLLLAYSDEATAAAKSVSGMEQMIGIAGVGTVGLFGVLASALKLPEAGKIELTEAEQDVVTAGIFF
ncbi:hypothetical protein Esi_0008_0251 [Ectocarpus siliculosus]|uniref:Uncharacterized protein n=1 Tax=Ectocarpus siliculosus TaxID=2880 RepID=D7G785_ECTSI|nr:hypothetical protein Esi_0008_0251 [Ectocarpus siliculosus]|eukprot:CBJ25778.1 hypothetical protein Esi_0008_0251 [Ectocarpus siliculosus]